MPFLLFLLSVATLVAVSSTSKASTSEGGRSQTFTLDADMPEPLRNQVLAALVSGTDPSTLDAFATAIQAQYPLSAGLLHSKATSLRAGIPGSPIVPASLPSAVDPGGPQLDTSMPSNLVAFVHSELANEADPLKLLALANQLASQYPIASGLLTERANVLNIQPQPATPPAPPPPPPPPPPSPPVGPPPPPTPALNMPGLDAGMPPDVAQRVMESLVTENDPAKLQALAQSLQAQYPLAANMLASKANTLLALQTQNVTPQQVVAPGVPSGPQVGLDAGMPSETVQLVLGELANEADPTKLQSLADQLAPQYPIAAGLLRTRANIILATRPPLEIIPTPSPPLVDAATYTVQQGDYPWKIAAHYTGQGGRWPELVAANPKKARAKDGNFASLLPGEKLSLPSAWHKASSTPIDTARAPVPLAPPPATLDAGIPADVASAVRNALATSTDATKLHGFGNAIANRGYPVAAGLLHAKADSLGAHPALVPGGTYKVKAGDSPSKIATVLVHDGSRWKELVAANPNKKRAHDGNFASLVPGEVLQLPASWTNARSAALPQGGV